MAAGAVGSVWAAGTWSDTAWEAETWADAAPLVPAVIPPSPTRLDVAVVATRLACELVVTALELRVRETRLGFQTAEGATMSLPIVMTAGETGPVTLICSGVDGTLEDLSAASSVTFTMLNLGTGTTAVDAVALTDLTSEGTGVWTRTAAQVGTPGDYLGQVRVVRSDGSVGYFPDAAPGIPITLLAPVGS